jgi:hypothetical protein
LDVSKHPGLHPTTGAVLDDVEVNSVTVSAGGPGLDDIIDRVEDGIAEVVSAEGVPDEETR